MRTDRPRILIAVAAILASSPTIASPRSAAGKSTGPIQINCDMLNFTGALDKPTERELGPAHTLDAAAAVLERHNVPFSRERATLTFGQMPKRMLDNLNALPPGEPIVLPNDTGGAICVMVPSAETY